MRSRQLTTIYSVGEGRTIVLASDGCRTCLRAFGILVKSKAGDDAAHERGSFAPGERGSSSLPHGVELPPPRERASLDEQQRGPPRSYGRSRSMEDGTGRENKGLSPDGEGEKGRTLGPLVAGAVHPSSSGLPPLTAKSTKNESSGPSRTGTALPVDEHDDDNDYDHDRGKPALVIYDPLEEDGSPMTLSLQPSDRLIVALLKAPAEAAGQGAHKGKDGHHHKAEAAGAKGKEPYLNLPALLLEVVQPPGAMFSSIMNAGLGGSHPSKAAQDRTGRHSPKEAKAEGEKASGAGSKGGKGTPKGAPEEGRKGSGSGKEAPLPDATEERRESASDVKESTEHKTKDDGAAHATSDKTSKPLDAAKAPHPARKVAPKMGPGKTTIFLPQADESDVQSALDLWEGLPGRATLPKLVKRARAAKLRFEAVPLVAEDDDDDDDDEDQPRPHFLSSLSGHLKRDAKWHASKMSHSLLALCDRVEASMLLLGTFHHTPAGDRKEEKYFDHLLEFCSQKINVAVRVLGEDQLKLAKPRRAQGHGPKSPVPSCPTDTSISTSSSGDILDDSG